MGSTNRDFQLFENKDNPDGPHKRFTSLGSETSFEKRPHKFLKLDRTYSDVVEDELYDASPPAHPVQIKAENHTDAARIQNVYPELFKQRNEAHDSGTNGLNYWMGMDSAVRFSNRPNETDVHMIADKMKRLHAQPIQATVSPKEAFLDYPDSVEFTPQKGLFDPPSQLSDLVSEQSSGSVFSRQSSMVSNDSQESNYQPAKPSVSNLMSPPKTITPVRNGTNQKVSPVPVEQYPSPQKMPHTPIRARVGKETSNETGDSSDTFDPSQDNSDGEFTPTSGRGTPRPMEARSIGDRSSPTTTYHCNECEKTFDKAHSLQVHRRTHQDDEERPKKPTGPHRCDWMNETTGKVCNTVFSRPYDLVRHQETIHNTRKQEFRCDICKVEKIFSRHDALVRHRRHVHKKG